MDASASRRSERFPYDVSPENHEIRMVAEGNVSRSSPCVPPLSGERLIVLKAKLIKFGYPISGWLFVDMIGCGTTSLAGRRGREDDDGRQTAQQLHIAIGRSRRQVFSHLHADDHVEGTPVSEAVPFKIEF